MHSFQGLDLVDQTPVFDIKPFVPFCDAPLDATAPPWVGVERQDEEEPLRMNGVVFADGAEAQLEKAWTDSKVGRALYTSEKDFTRFVAQVLSFDVRSLRERKPKPHRTAKFVDYRITLANILIQYNITADKKVTVFSAENVISAEGDEDEEQQAANES